MAPEILTYSNLFNRILLLLLHVYLLTQDAYKNSAVLQTICHKHHKHAELLQVQASGLQHSLLFKCTSTGQKTDNSNSIKLLSQEEKHPKYLHPNTALEAQMFERKRRKK